MTLHKPVAGQVAHVLLRPERAVGADHRANAPLGRVARHRAQVFVHQRLAADKQQVADVVLHADVNHVPRLAQRHAAPLLGIEPVHRKAAEVALGVADVGDGELEIARPAMLEHLAQQLEPARPWAGAPGAEASTPAPAAADGAPVRANRAVLMPVNSRILSGKASRGANLSSGGSECLGAHLRFFRRADILIRSSLTCLPRQRARSSTAGKTRSSGPAPMCPRREVTATPWQRRSITIVAP